MKNKPVISIIIPVFNAEKTISTCLNSLFAQTYNSLELLFVNDCCTDNSFEVIRKFIDSNSHKTGISAKIINLEKNRGVASARNTGLDNASGEYIYYVDSDDWMEPDLIEMLVKEAETKKSDIVGCEWFLTYKQNERYMKQASATSPDEAFRKMTGGVLRWNLWLFMTKRSLYEDNNIRFTEGQNMGEDMMVMGKLFLSASSVSIVHKPLYHYIQTNESSLTKDVSEKHLAQVTANLEELERFTFQKKGIEYATQIHFLKLNIKLPLLISDNDNMHRRWMQMFPESNKYIMQNRLLPLRTRLLQWFASKQNFAIVKLYYKFVFKFVYGKLYK